MKKPKCLLYYHKFNNTDLDTFSNEVRNGIYTNPTTFATPPVTEATLESLQDDFGTAAADYTQYGITKKVAFDSARVSLIDALDTLSVYVDKVADGNVSTIALSGFVPTSETSQPAAPLLKIDSFEISLTKSSGEIVVSIPAYSGQPGVSYGCVCIPNQPLTNPSIVNGQFRFSGDDKSIMIDVSRGRQKIFTALEPGVKHFFYAFANNTAGVSPLSNPQSIYVS